MERDGVTGSCVSISSASSRRDWPDAALDWHLELLVANHCGRAIFYHWRKKLRPVLTKLEDILNICCDRLNCRLVIWINWIYCFSLCNGNVHCIIFGCYHAVDLFPQGSVAAIRRWGGQINNCSSCVVDILCATCYRNWPTFLENHSEMNKWSK